MSDTIIVGNVHSRTPPQADLLPPLLDPADPDSPSASSSTSSSSAPSSPLASPTSPKLTKEPGSKSTKDKPGGDQEEDQSTQRLVPEQVCVSVLRWHSSLLSRVLKSGMCCISCGIRKVQGFFVCVLIIFVCGCI